MTSTHDEATGRRAATLFAAVPAQTDWSALEREILSWWAETRAFERLVDQNEGGARWSFQDGPITANNPMGVHHAWGRTYKDVWQRFEAMRGRDQRWQNGFDCQGLWVEVNVERELEFKTKRDIERFGLAAFNRRCKARVLQMAALQTEQSIRLGMWMHWDDPDTLRWLAERIDQDGPVTVETPSGPVTDTVERLVGRLGHAPWNGSYFTFADENNYMIWQFLKTCHERGWLYHGVDVMPWCARCGTGLSQHEITVEGYQELTHVSPTVRFPLVDRPGEALLVWTTTPWTLSSNVAAAVGPDLVYLKVRQGDAVYYLAEGTARQALAGDYEVLDHLKGADLVGWRYTGPFDYLPAQGEAREHHRVVAWTEVGEAEGTGIVHIAPGCGAEDFELGKGLGLPAVAPLNEDGHFIEGFDWLTGREALEVAGDVMADLDRRGLLYRAQSYTHRYPVCWRCQSELVFRLVDEWFISMGRLYDKPREAVTEDEKAASLRYQMMDVVDDIRWIPGFGRDRELDWLRNMRDWMISKKRYWGLALPIWRCAECGWFDVIGSREELEARAVAGWSEFDGHAPHRPHVDAVAIRCGQCGAVTQRIPDVGNPWLDAGIVPYSTVPYRADRAEWAKWFPADFICESFPGQYRNWFYSLLAMSTVLERAAPFRTVLGYATLFAEDGREMHKSWGNAIEFNEAAERMGADVMRWMYCAHRPEQNLNFGYGPGSEVVRRFLIPLWNVYAFLVQYANVADGWRPSRLVLPPTNVPEGADGWRRADRTAPERGDTWGELDRWLELRLGQVVREVTDRLADYDAQRATAALEAFVEDLSNWYVRRSRRRFWDGEAAALDALYTALVTLVRLLAPFTPFATEAIYQNLVRSLDPDAPLSVHHVRWPEAPVPGPEDERLLAEMALVERLAALGRSARAASNVKLRQPLASATMGVRSPEEETAVRHQAEHLAQELNVKTIEVVRGEGALVVYTVRPVLPRLGPRFGKQVPAIRAALLAADAGQVAARVHAGEPVVLTVDGETLALEAEDVEVMAQARPGLATAEEGGYVVGISTAITEELRTEGLARDVVRRVQQLRKDSGLHISDRIHLVIESGPGVAAAVETWRDYVAGETLALSLACAPVTGDLPHVAEDEIEGEAVRIGVRKDG
jgi:isoleucyl-tRNA synthetase